MASTVFSDVTSSPIVSAWLNDVNAVTYGLTSFGAVGDGVVDDRPAFVTAIAALTALGGGRITLEPGASYRISSRLSIPSNVEIVGDGSSTIVALATDFTNNTLSKYLATSCVFDCSGLTAGPYTATTNVKIRGVKFQWTGATGFLVDCINARNVVDLEISNCRFSGFPVGADIRAASLTGRSMISNNYHSGRTSSVDLGAGMQLSAIELDNDKVNSVPSYGVHIVRNRIDSILLSGAALTARGMQTDGINIQGARTSLGATDYSAGHVVSHNIISNVGEGIDHFGWYSTIDHNTITDCYYTGIKLIHGASFNSGTGNVIKRCKIGGILLASSTGTTTANVANNSFSGGTISDINYLNDVVDPTNRQSCLRTDNISGSNLVVDNLFSGIVLDPGTYGKYAIYRESDGLRNDFIDMKFVQKGTVGWAISDHGDTGRITASRPTAFRATMGSVTSIPGASVQTKLVFTAAAIDDRTEFDAANQAWQCQIPGKYRARGTVRFATIASGSLIQAQLRLDGAAIKTETAQTSSSNEAVVTVSDVFVAIEGQRVQLFAAQSTGGAINAQTADTTLVVEPA